jgi:type II secretion system protein H
VKTRQIQLRCAAMTLGRSTGFTLIEIMLVLALIGIMAGMIVPEMKGSMEDALLRASARKVVDVFNLTYSRAISLNLQHRILLDTQTGRYRVEQQRTGMPGPLAFRPVTDVNDLEGQLDSRIEIQVRPMMPENSDQQIPEDELSPATLNNGINFYSDGTADGCQIRLRDRTGAELILELNPVTGNVHLIEQAPP